MEHDELDSLLDEFWTLFSKIQLPASFTFSLIFSSYFPVQVLYCVCRLKLFMDFKSFFLTLFFKRKKLTLEWAFESLGV